MTESVNACVALRADGVGLVLDATCTGLPAVAHWGPDLGELSESDARGLILGGVEPVMANLVDEPVRLALLPEHWTGWVGRPGLSGSRAGRDWSPKFRTVALRIDGQPVAVEDTSVGGGPIVINRTGPAVVEADAVDDVAQLSVTIVVELAAGGLVRTRATLTNLGETYQLDDLVLALPVPAAAREILDFAGRWG